MLTGAALLLGNVALGGTTTFDPSAKGASVVLSNGNLTMTKAAATEQVASPTVFRISSGKYYSEFTVSNLTGDLHVGQCSSGVTLSNYLGSDINGLGYKPDGTLVFNGGLTATFAAYTTGDFIGYAVNFVTGKVWFSKNGIWQSGSPETGTGGFTLGPNPVGPAASTANSNTVTVNNGQNPFVYDVPTGFSQWG